ncbi:DNA-binding FadR family transcriptional regulator [Saccharothrix ecbatanensis]|jgi:DNA-binding FadR family transcriptional regulator|uniref:DNA-binding FadR family transcriptional regulator n=1 Tax=Saccharothrix ecbatanensis TaxID=1105145 RepID=A0A7W9HKY5_9PSEU|nr:GntR family transcriptional regulator [Saccharothrix ecbatanensis]MBB5804217.1 DNA-binding FadR family transcriptional regulator [Saccharothrix ecbatanensis]
MPVQDALFRPVRAGNAFEETVERLMQAIRLGVVGPGERLPAERELATRLGVSRVTLREAIRSLQDAGYVESRRGRYGGTFVKSPVPVPAPDRRVDPEELADALTLRAAVETGAAECAAARALGPSDRRNLVARLTECRDATLEEYRRKDSRLHLAIAEATGSASLTAAVADARTRVNALLDRIPLLAPNLAHSNEQHEVIVAGIVAGEPEAARRAMAEHLDGTALLLRGFLS